MVKKYVFVLFVSVRKMVGSKCEIETDVSSDECPF
jgi:hypothetical protein